MQQAQKRVLAGDLGAPQSGPSGQDAGATGDAGIDHREGNRQGRRAQPGRGGVRQPAAAEDASCNPIRPSSTAWSAARARSAGRSSAAKSSSRRPTTPMSSTVCRPGRSPIPGAPRWKRPPIRRAPAICISWPTAPADTPSATPTSSIRRTSPSCARWKSRSRTIPPNRPRMPPPAAAAPAEAAAPAATRQAGGPRKQGAKPRRASRPARCGAIGGDASGHSALARSRPAAGRYRFHFGRKCSKVALVASCESRIV